MLLGVGALALCARSGRSWVFKINIGPGLEFGNELVATEDFTVLLDDPSDLNVHTTTRNVRLLERTHRLFRVVDIHWLGRRWRLVGDSRRGPLDGTTGNLRAIQCKGYRCIGVIDIALDQQPVAGIVDEAQIRTATGKDRRVHADGVVLLVPGDTEAVRVQSVNGKPA